MNLLNYDYLKKYLLKNDEAIKELDNKIAIIDKNRRDERWAKSLLLGFPIYSIQLIMVLNFGSAIPFVTTTCLLFNSIILGKGVETILFHKSKYKEKLNNISNSKSFQQLILEQVNYEIEKEELMAENELLEKMTIHSVKDNEKYLYDLNLNIKNKVKISTLCKKKVLKNKFMGYFNFLDSYATSFFTGVQSSLISYVSTGLIYSFIAPCNLVLDIIIPSLLLGGAISGSVIRDNLIIAKTFKKVNETLKNNKMVYKNFYDNNIECELKKVLDKCGDSLISQCKNTYLDCDIKKDKTNDYSYCYENKLVSSYDYVNLDKHNKVKTRKKELIQK